jgi:peptide-methionine (S)-S-oxide reductase
LNQSKKKEVATLAGGCFWCLEAVFAELEGIEKAVSGYAGGRTANPSYQEVCTGKTGHAEAVQITFDPKVVSYKDILEVFFQIHDPTMLNRQGADVGTQYRSAIFYHNAEQKAMAEQMIQQLDAAKVWKSAIVTEVKPFSAFYPAEDYHQEYFRRNASQPYCQAVIAPKLEKVRKHYSDRLKRSQ